MKISILLVLGLFMNFLICQSQDSLSILSLPKQMFSKIDNQQLLLAEKIQKNNLHFISTLKKQEIKIYQRLKRIDSIKANEFYKEIASKYDLLEKKLSGKAKDLMNTKVGTYNPRLDSLSTMLKFLSPLITKKEQLKKASGSVDELNYKLSQLDDIKSFVAERQEVLNKLTLKFAKLPAGLTKTISRYKKEVYYYNDRIKGWKESVNDPQKVEQEALKLLNKLPAFKSFMQQNGELGRLFGSPISNSTQGVGNAMPGLQTRASIQSAIQQQIGSGINPQQYLQQQMQSAQVELSTLKNKLDGLTSGDFGNGDTPNMPGFTPNGQKNKSFLKRLQVGWNLQTGGTPIRFTSFNFPTTNDLAASIGYKLNDRSIVGIGVAYKFGLSGGFKNLALTHDGMGLRTFVEYKLTSPKKNLLQLFSNIWLTGGYEQNYWSRFDDISALFPTYVQNSGRQIWQKSGLLGISKKVKRGKSEMKIQALWDFLSYDTGAKSFVFRIGYNL